MIIVIRVFCSACPLTCWTSSYSSSLATDWAAASPPGISTAHSFRYCLSPKEDPCGEPGRTEPRRARTQHITAGRHLTSISETIQPEEVGRGGKEKDRNPGGVWRAGRIRAALIESRAMKRSPPELFGLWRSP